jgi:hypothetical protein
MAKNIYDQHRAAFANVSAYVVMRDNERVANIAFKFPRDGASRLYAYVHWFGIPMVRGSAGGYGYDKKTAACNSASRALPQASYSDSLEAFTTALAIDDGNDWERNLRNAGFDVLQAV